MKSEFFDKNQDSSEALMLNRRNLLAGAGAVLAAASAGKAFAADDNQGGHGMVHSKKYQAVTDSALHCVMMGQACLEHCLAMFKSGDTSLAECARQVLQLSSMCQTLAQFASLESAHLANMAKLCIEVGDACEKECRKHADKHMDCKNCADSCLECIKQCKKIAA